MNFNIDRARRWIEKTNLYVQQNKQVLTKLDRAIGDGDHGINMARGFNEVIITINDNEYETISDLMKDVAFTLMSKVGGVAGPLYGTAFLKISQAWHGKEDIDYNTFVKGFEEAVFGIKQRGGTTKGEKTLVDVWAAVAHYLLSREEIEADQLKEVAYEAVEKTKEMIGTKGRSAYLKENTLGHIDPGAMSSYYIFLSLSEVLKGDENESRRNRNYFT